VEPPSDYHADNSRSDLSDILEEEEEDFYSDHLGDAQARGCIFRANRVKQRVHCMFCGHLHRHLRVLLFEGNILSSCIVKSSFSGILSYFF